MAFNFGKLDKFPSDFDNFFSDNFSFRTPLLKAFHEIKFKLFQIPPDRNDLVFGEDGWYFLGGEEKRIFEGRENFNTEELDKFQHIWEERLNYLKSKNIKTYWLICPTKHHIYSEKLTNKVRKTPFDSRTVLLTKFLKKNTPDLVVINAVNHLKKLKKSGPLYFKLDNHWNDKAGFEIAKLLLNTLKIDFPLIPTSNLDGYSWKQRLKNDGIHKAALGINELSEWVPVIDKRTEFAIPVKKYGFASPKDFPYAWKYEMRFHNKSNGKYRILIIRDSFADAIQPFLKEAFEESVFIFDNWKYNLDKEIIETVKPDIILYISLETHLKNFLLQH